MGRFLIWNLMVGLLVGTLGCALDDNYTPTSSPMGPSGIARGKDVAEAKRNYEDAKKAYEAAMQKIQEIEKKGEVIAIEQAKKEVAEKKKRLEETAKDVWVQELTEASTAASGVTVLTPNNLILDGAPSISKDGLLIVFCARDENDKFFHLWKMRATGGAVTKITSDRVSDLYPVLAQEDSSVIFASPRRGQNFELWKTSISGIGGLAKLGGTNLNSDIQPHVSLSDKPNVVFVNRQMISDKDYVDVVWTMNINGSELTQLRAGFLPRFSPDGNKILFEFGSDIWLMDVDGSEITQLTNNAKSGMPYWSPDGTKICFASWQGGNWDIWLMDADGTGTIQLTQNPSADLSPVWAQGGQIYFLSNRGTGKNALWRMKLKLTELPIPKEQKADSGTVPPPLPTPTPTE